MLLSLDLLHNPELRPHLIFDLWGIAQHLEKETHKAAHLGSARMSSQEIIYLHAYTEELVFLPHGSG